MVTNCVLQNFGNAGIQFFPASDSVGINFLIEDTLLSNVEVGVNYSPTNGLTTTARGTIKNVVATNNNSDLLSKLLMVVEQRASPSSTALPVKTLPMECRSITDLMHLRL